MSRKNISCSLSSMLLLLFVLIGFTAQGQMKFNQHNPYVSNSEIFKLKQLGIDLSEKPIRDEAFQLNVRDLIINQSAHKRAKAVKAGSTALGIAGLAILIAGIVVGPNQRASTFAFKYYYINVGVLLIGGATIGYVRNIPKFKKSKSKFNQLLKITKGQYDVLLPN